MLNSDPLPPADQTPPPNGRLREVTLVLLLLVVCVVVDQVSKRWATTNLQHAETLSFFGDSFRLQYAMNSGGFLSVGSELSKPVRFALFIGFNLVLMCGLGWFLCAAPRNRRVLQAGVGFLFAGGIGNLIDRLTQNGHVIDFMNIGIGGLRTGIFNVADIAIVVGAVLVASGSWTARDEQPTTAIATCNR